MSSPEVCLCRGRLPAGVPGLDWPGGEAAAADFRSRSDRPIAVAPDIEVGKPRFSETVPDMLLAAEYRRQEYAQYRRAETTILMT